MKLKFSEIEDLFPGYLSGDLSDKERSIFDKWRKESSENEALYQETLKAWEAIPLLHEMEQFNSFEALKKVNKRISQPYHATWRIIFQRAAAILLLPLLVYSGYLTFNNLSEKKVPEENVMMQTVTARQGMVSQFMLSDNTKVWLNSNSELQFPLYFTGDLREVKLKGEALFKVAKNEKQPFKVNTKSIDVEVLGTCFNVLCYDDDTQAEVTLVEGSVRLSSKKGRVKNDYGTMQPGQRAVFYEGSREILTKEVDVDKYISWSKGILIFRDDAMEDVIKRLSRWFNVEIVINDPEVESYIYTATFRNETLEQVLKLLKLSAPIDYRIVRNKALTDSTFSEQKIYLMKKKI